MEILKIIIHYKITQNSGIRLHNKSYKSSHLTYIRVEAGEDDPAAVGVVHYVGEDHIEKLVSFEVMVAFMFSVLKRIECYRNRLFPLPLASLDTSLRRWNRHQNPPWSMHRRASGMASDLPSLPAPWIAYRDAFSCSRGPAERSSLSTSITEQICTKRGTEVNSIDNYKLRTRQREK